MKMVFNIWGRNRLDSQVHSENNDLQAQSTANFLNDC